MSVPGAVHLVTGSSGIGAATAARLVADGDAVFVVSRTQGHAHELAERLDPAGERVAAHVADLTVESEVEGTLAACVARFGRLDGLLSVAGGSGRSHGDGPIHELSAEGWDWTIELNLRSQALVARAAIRQMLRQRPAGERNHRGSVVLVSSVLAWHPVPELFATHAYAAAKGAITTLGRVLAASYARDGIRVNIIAPGLTATPMARRAATDAASVAFARRKQPLAGGLVEPDDVAEAAVFLMQPAARAITGQVIAVDGGWSVVSASPDAGGPEPA